MSTIVIVALTLLAVSVAVNIYIFVRKGASTRAVFRAKQEASNILDKAKQEAEKVVREAEISIREKLLAKEAEFEHQTRDKQRKFNDMERRLINKEENLERRVQVLERKEKDFSGKENRIFQKEKELAGQEEKINQLIKQEMVELERISGLTQEEAKNLLVRKIEDEAKLEAGQRLRHIEEETLGKSQALSLEIIIQAIQLASGGAPFGAPVVVNFDVMILARWGSGAHSRMMRQHSATVAGGGAVPTYVDSDDYSLGGTAARQITPAQAQGFRGNPSYGALYTNVDGLVNAGVAIAHNMGSATGAICLFGAGADIGLNKPVIQANATSVLTMTLQNAVVAALDNNMIFFVRPYSPSSI